MSEQRYTEAEIRKAITLELSAEDDPQNTFADHVMDRLRPVPRNKADIHVGPYCDINLNVMDQETLDWIKVTGDCPACSRGPKAVHLGTVMAGGFEFRQCPSCLAVYVIDELDP